MLKAEDIPHIGSAAKKIKGFTDFIGSLRNRLINGELSLRELIEAIYKDSGYEDELKKEDPISAETRLENIEELINKAVSFEADRQEEEMCIRDRNEQNAAWIADELGFKLISSNRLMPSTDNDGFYIAVFEKKY